MSSYDLQLEGLVIKPVTDADRLVSNMVQFLWTVYGMTSDSYKQSVLGSALTLWYNAALQATRLVEPDVFEHEELFNFLFFCLLFGIRLPPGATSFALPTWGLWQKLRDMPMTNRNTGIGMFFKREGSKTVPSDMFSAEIDFGALRKCMEKWVGNKFLVEKAFKAKIEPLTARGSGFYIVWAYIRIMASTYFLFVPRLHVFCKRFLAILFFWNSKMHTFYVEWANRLEQDYRKRWLYMEPRQSTHSVFILLLFCLISFGTKYDNNWDIIHVVNLWDGSIVYSFSFLTWNRVIVT